MSLSFVITSAATVQSTLLVRSMQFRSLEVRTMLSVVIGAAVGLWAAVQGYGAWAIILQQVAGASRVDGASVGGDAVAAAACATRSRRCESLGGFSANVFGTRLLFYVNRNVDNLLVGRFLGAAALGAYSIAYTIMLVPVQPDRQPRPGGAVPGDVADAGRPAPDGDGLAARQPPDREPLAAVAGRRGGGCAGYRRTSCWERSGRSPHR